MAKPVPPKAAAPPDDFAQVEPEELFPTNNIRFVMWETAKLTERVEGLTRAIDKLAPAFEKSLERHSLDQKERIADLKSDFKETDGKVVEIEKKVSFVKGVMWVLGGIFAAALVLLSVIAGKLLS